MFEKPIDTTENREYTPCRFTTNQLKETIKMATEKTLDVSTLNFDELSVEQLEEIRTRAWEAKKSKMPKPISINARNNKLSIEKKVTGILQSIRVLVQEGAFDDAKQYINGQFARLADDKLIENAMNVIERTPRGRAAAALKAAE